MNLKRLVSFCVAFLMAGIAYSQVQDSVTLIFADSLKAVYIYADTGKAINRIDAQGRKQGLWEKRYANGKLRYRGHFLNNNPNGVFKYYWDNDSVQNIAVYSNLGKVSYSHMFYENGGLFSLGKFIDQKRDSIWLFYDESLKLIKKEQYVLGKKEGKSVFFYTNGNVAEIKTWHNDLENGPWQKFFDDGQVQVDGSYVNGRLDGWFRQYTDGDPDETIAEGRYHNDDKEGRWIYHNSVTNKPDTLRYKNGVLLNAEKYKLTQQKLDSIKMQSNELQQQLDNRGNQDYNNGGGR